MPDNIDFDKLGIYAKYDQKKILYILSEGYGLEYAMDNYKRVTIYPGHNLASLQKEFTVDSLTSEEAKRLIPWIDFEAYSKELHQDNYIEHNGDVFRMN